MNQYVTLNHLMICTLQITDNQPKFCLCDVVLRLVPSVVHRDYGGPSSPQRNQKYCSLLEAGFGELSGGALIIESVFTAAADGLLAASTLLFAVSSHPAAAFGVFFSGLGYFK